MNFVGFIWSFQFQEQDHTSTQPTLPFSRGVRCAQVLRWIPSPKLLHEATQSEESFNLSPIFPISIIINK